MIDIRLATESDLPTLKKLVAFASEELAAKCGTARMDNVVYGLIERGVHDGEAVVVAEDSTNIIGWCARVSRPELPHGEVQGVGTWVFQPYRREKVARDMRRLADRHAKQLGARYVIGVASIKNDAGIKSVLAEGYEVYGEEREHGQIVGLKVRKPL